MESLSWLGVFLTLLFVYNCDSRERLNNIVNINRFTRSQGAHENRGLFANVKNVRNAAKNEAGHEIKRTKKGYKKQVVDAIHVGPYHHGGSWGTTSVWPGFADWRHAWGSPTHHEGWMGYSSYRSHVPSKQHSVDSHPRSSIHNSQTVKRWWPGYMGGWGNWGWGNNGYPGLGGLGFGHALGWGHPLLRSGVPRATEGASKRWWPGYMGGWGGWGWGNTGYPGWGWGGWRRGNGLGHAHRSDVLTSSSIPKRHYIDAPFDGFNDYFGHGFNIPWGPPIFNYGPINDLGEWGYPEFGFGPRPLAGFGPRPFAGFNQDVYYKSKIPKRNEKGNTKEGSGMARQFVRGFHPGSYGWIGVINPGYGLGDPSPLLAAYTAAGSFYKSMIPKEVQEHGESRQVINYHPGCQGWGGCLYPGCGYMGSFRWPCHHGCCRTCCCRSKTPSNQGSKSEKGRSRQEITSPDDDEDEEKKQMLGSSSEKSMRDITKLAMGFPGLENLRSPFGSNIDPLSGSVAAQLGISNQMPSPAMNEPNELMQQSDGIPELPQSFKPLELTTNEQSDETAQPSEDLLTNFNMSPEGDTGMPLATDGGGGTSEQASRRGIIPQVKETARAKKQAVTYPYYYASTAPAYYMAHGINPYAAMVPHVRAYPASYPQGAQLVGHVADPQHPSHSIHVGAPNVNVDVQTTRTHVAERPEKERGHILKFVGRAVKTVTRLRRQKGQKKKPNGVASSLLSLHT